MELPRRGLHLDVAALIVLEKIRGLVCLHDICIFSCTDLTTPYASWNQTQWIILGRARLRCRKAESLYFLLQLDLSGVE